MPRRGKVGAKRALCLALLAGVSGCGSSDSPMPFPVETLRPGPSTTSTPSATPSPRESTPTASPTPFVVGEPGELDRSFGEGGLATFDFGGETSRVTDLALQADGRIVVVGSSSDGEGRSVIAAARLLPDGSLDPTFGAGGVVRTDVASRLGPCGPGPACMDAASAVGLAADGRIVAVGTTENEAVSPARRFTLVRYLPDGALDAGFGDGGVVTTALAEGGSLSDLAIDAQGRLVVVGTVDDGDPSDPVVARYRPAGDLDPDFASDGVMILPEFPESDPTRVFSHVTIEPGGSIVAGGWFRLLDIFGRLVRFHPDGSLDLAYGSDGIASPFPVFGFTGSLAFQSTGRLLSSTGSSPPTEPMLLAGVAADGELDDEFGDQGIVETVSRTPLELGVDAQDRIALAGATDAHALLVERRTRDGALDPAFGDGGANVVAMPGLRVLPVGLTLQNDGRILVAIQATDPEADSRCHRDCGEVSAVLRFLGDRDPVLPGNPARESKAA